MTKIVFRGQEYNSLADMPAQVRHDYFMVKAGYDDPKAEAKSESGMLPAGLEQMPDEVREIYERVRGDLDAKPLKTSPVDDLPDTEELYRRSASQGLRDVPSDELVYNPSPPLIKPPPPVIESDRTFTKLVVGLLLVLLAAGAALAFILSM
jgi:hypothetical protein